MTVSVYPAVRADTAKTPASFATIGTSSAALVASNPGRIEVAITNDSANIVYLSLGGTAVVGSGIRLNASGGSYTTTSFTGAINAIASAASSNVSYSEV